MTTEEKNIEIAKMLGDFKYYEEVEIGMDICEDCWHWISKDEYYQDLDFHSDANWQFEAIDWINKQGYFFDCSSEPNNSAFAHVNHWGDEGYLVSIVNTHGNKLGLKNAVFEALYQFSQYIKNKT